MHRRFQYPTLEDLERDLSQEDIQIKLSDQLDILRQPVDVDGIRIPNAMVYHPMEGGDANRDGSPSDLTYRKYRRYARGGGGLIWLEAVSVCEEGRSNPGQLMITEENIASFRKLRKAIVKEAQEIYGKAHRPIIIVQLNHSGRYSKPDGSPKPIIATHKPLLDKAIGIDHSYPIVTDEYLDRLKEDYIVAARLCMEAGFDGVDVKACHGYLLSELLSAYERDGRYGSSFSNRTALMCEIIDALKENLGHKELIISARINLYDGVPYPQGFGVQKDGYLEMDLIEPVALVRLLVQKGVRLINITMGNPYLIPHVNRPYDRGGYVPEESPLHGNNRLIMGGAYIQKEVPEAIIVGVGYSWFGQYAPNVAAGSLAHNYCKLVGFGRLGIAYPDFPRDIVLKGKINRKKVCVTCSKCSYMKKNIGICGCVIRDAETYLAMYRDIKQ